jgi:hypothetical protein
MTPNAYAKAAFDGAVAGCMEQVAIVERVRTRVITIIGVGGLVGTLLGPEAHGRWRLAGVGCFVAVIAVATWLQLPVSLMPGLDPVAMITDVDPKPVSAPDDEPVILDEQECFRSGALNLDVVYRRQAPTVRLRLRAAAAASLLVGCEVVCFLVARRH